MEDGGKKDKPQSPTQYYLSELGLNLDWHNNLLQFGPADQSGQDYINNLRMQGTYDRNAMRIRTYPHICVSAAKDSIYDLPPLDLLQTEEGQEKGEGRETAESKTDKKPFLQTKLPRRECESNCWASNAMDVVLESLKNALPKVPQEHTLETAASGPQVINSVIEILRAYPEALHRINELERANDRLKDGIPAQKEEP